MNAKELINHAIGVQDHVYSWDEPVEILAQYILDTVKPDDDKPITREWLLTIPGFSQVAYHDEPVVWGTESNGLEYDIVFGDSGLNYGPVDFPLIKSRGQMRQLLRLLGLEFMGRSKK